MTIEEGEAAVVAETTEPAPATETADTRNYETEARDMGWVPETEFRGPKEKWKPAQKFVEDGENFLPILKANERKLRMELAKERSTFAERLARIERVNAATTERLTEDYNRQVAEIKSAQIKAVEAGDTAEFKRLDKQRESLKAPEPVEDITVDNAPPADLVDFKKANTWYETDPVLTRYAISYSDELGARNPGMSLADNLRHVQEEMRRAFPEKLGGGRKPAANGHAAVDGGGDFPGGGSNKADPLAKLPAEARAQAKADMKAYPKIYPNAEAWAKIYTS